MSRIRREPIQVIDLDEKNRELYYVCLEEWSEDLKEAGPHKECWHRRMKKRGLGVKIALDSSGEACGMIQYLPVEYSFVEGKDLYLILCIWVHGHKKGRGDRRGHGMGRALLEAAEADIRSRGAKGVAAWGMILPFWMKASWFKKHGYQKADRDGLRDLMWKPFTDDAQPPRWIKVRKTPGTIPGKVAATSFLSGWCPVRNLLHERVSRASAELGDPVVFRTVDAADRKNFLEWGLADCVFIDGQPFGWGPPMSYAKVLARMTKKVRKLPPPPSS